MNRKEASWSWFDQIYEYEFRVFLEAWSLRACSLRCGSLTFVWFGRSSPAPLLSKSMFLEMGLSDLRLVR